MRYSVYLKKFTDRQPKASRSVGRLGFRSTLPSTISSPHFTPLSAVISIEVVIQYIGAK